MNKKILILLILALIVLSGCIKVNVFDKISADGTSSIEMKMDMSALASFPQTEGEELTPEKLCESVLESPEEGQTGELALTSKSIADVYQNVNCTATKDFIVTVTGTRKLDASEYSTEGGVFKYSPSSSSSESYGGTVGQNPEQLQQLKSVGMEITYTVEMPGKILKAEGAIEIKDNTAKFDFLQNPVKKIEVESQLPGAIDFNLILGAGVVVLILLLIGLFFLVKQKRQ